MTTASGTRTNLEAKKRSLCLSQEGSDLTLLPAQRVCLVQALTGAASPGHGGLSPQRTGGPTATGPQSGTRLGETAKSGHPAHSGVSREGMFQPWRSGMAARSLIGSGRRSEEHRRCTCLPVRDEGAEAQRGRAAAPGWDRVRSPAGTPAQAIRRPAPTRGVEGAPTAAQAVPRGPRGGRSEGRSLCGLRPAP